MAGHQQILATHGVGQAADAVTVDVVGQPPEQLREFPLVDLVERDGPRLAHQRLAGWAQVDLELVAVHAGLALHALDGVVRGHRVEAVHVIDQQHADGVQQAVEGWVAGRTAPRTSTGARAASEAASPLVASAHEKLRAYERRKKQN